MVMNQNTTLLFATFLGATAVALGAFGAHALKPTLSALGTTQTFELASRYHFYHALALLGCGIMMHYLPSTTFQYAALFFVIGIVFFSGSLYAMSLLKYRWLGPITPIGGVFLIAGWVTLFIGVFKARTPS
jgi:uncharacterized membrane protein YgdD (TMEM256/DUF423 family)